MTQMTQSIVHSSIHAVLRLGHLARWRGQLITQMTQLCKFCIVAIYLQLGVDSVKKSLTIATLANEKPVKPNLI
jgi:hypothetical protein